MSDITRRGWFGQMAAALVGAEIGKALPEMLTPATPVAARTAITSLCVYETVFTCVAYDPTMQRFFDARTGLFTEDRERM